MNQVATPKFGIGAPVRRTEDTALVTGTGCFVADVPAPDALQAYLVRSPFAHASFTIGDLEPARNADGVHLVFTAADVADLGNLPCVEPQEQPDGTRPPIPAYRVLAESHVRHVGDAVAFIVADSVNAAKSAAELIDIDWEPLDAAAATASALDGATPLVWPQFGTNAACTMARGDKAATARAFDEAHTITQLELINNRLVANYMEPRGCIAEIDETSGRITVTAGTQGGHGFRDRLCRDVLKIDPEDMRVVTPDVGGGFGTKAFVYREYPLCVVAARRLGRPVRWIGERTEHFVGDAHGRDNVTTCRLALDADGRILALEVNTIANLGAYLSQFGPFIPYLGITMATGLYDIPAYYAHATGVYTHTAPVDAYRGAGRPEAAYLIERLMDAAGRDTGLGPVEIRRRNFIQPEAMPYTTLAGRKIDVGEFAGHLERGLEVSDWSGFDARLEQSKAQGKVRGIGLATYIEACAFAGSEEATLQLNGDGTVTLFIGTQANGQGHATAYAQVAAEPLGLTVDDFRLVQGDTDQVRKGGGTGGSRSIPLGAASVDIAARTLSWKLRDLAAERLETATQDVELADGHARIVGTDQSISLADLARSADNPAALRALGNVRQDEATYPNGTHVCEVEIDPETGLTTVEAYHVVDDFGVTVNPLLLAGQVHGGIVQGAGQALMEDAVYDETGQLLAASFMDYCMPRAEAFPTFHFETRNVPSTTNRLGIKGAGEAGTIGATPAVMNAVGDALYRAYGIAHFDMPATPLRVWGAIRAATR